MATNKTIFLKSGREGEPLPKEARAQGSTILPGMLLERVYDTDAIAVKVHSVSGGGGSKLVAVEDSNQGSDIDDIYADNSRVSFIVPGPGDELNMLLANGANASVGSKLESNADGYLIVAGEDSGDAPTGVMFEALEALDMSDSDDVDPASQRIAVEVI